MLHTRTERIILSAKENLTFKLVDNYPPHLLRQEMKKKKGHVFYRVQYPSISCQVPSTKTVLFNENFVKYRKNKENEVSVENDGDFFNDFKEILCESDTTITFQ